MTEGQRQNKRDQDRHKDRGWEKTKETERIKIKSVKKQKHKK